MNKTVMLVLFLAGITFSSNLEISQKNSVYGGVAFPIGKGSGNKNIGANGGFESFTQFDKYFGLGGHLEYTWSSIDFPEDISGYFKGALHYWDIAVIFKGLSAFSDVFSFYAELAPAFYLGLTTLHTDYDDHYTWEPDFGLSFGTGAIIGTFVIGWRFKIAFTKQQTTKWMTITIGLCG